MFSDRVPHCRYQIDNGNMSDRHVKSDGVRTLKLAFRVVDPRVDSPRLVVLATTFMTIPIMCPYMSLVSIALHRGITTEIVAQWLQAMAFNLPLAFFSQFLLIGPTVRLAFRKAYRLPSVPPPSHLARAPPPAKPREARYAGGQRHVTRCPRPAQRRRAPGMSTRKRATSTTPA